MMLIPQPSKMEENGENFLVGPGFEIVLGPSCGFPEFRAARLLKAEIRRAVCVECPIGKSGARPRGGLFVRKTDSPGEEYRLSVAPGGAELTGGADGIFRGVQTLRQIVRQCGAVWPGVAISDAPRFRTRGFFHDVTRGKVPTLETLKDLADRLAFYKINQLQLYVEHTFAFRGFSEAWTGKDPLTAEEILELDGYCRERHIELVPSLATFGHLYEILATKTWRKCCELPVDDSKPFSWYERMAHHTLNTADEESFELVRRMLDQYLPLFSSGQFNIGCDETFDIGVGKSAALVRQKGRGRVYVDFLKKIIAYVQSKGKKVLFWGDIILKTPEYLREIPKGTQCLYWNYGPDVPESEVKAVADSGVKFTVCPGVCGWNRMMNLFENAFLNISRMVRFGRKYGAEGVLNTDWGDFGHINLFANSMPGMALGAALSWNPDDSRGWREFAEAYGCLEFGAAGGELMRLLTELSRLQAGTWADVVCWRETRKLGSKAAGRDRGRLLSMDDSAALRGYRRALELERRLAAVPCPEPRRTDLAEYICSARGVALVDAACLALKKYAYSDENAPLALKCGNLAESFEVWFRRYEALWRRRNRESELYRIRRTVQDLCAFLRDCAQSREKPDAVPHRQGEKQGEML